MDVTNITVVYDENNEILRYEVAVRGGNGAGATLSANVTLEPADFDITALSETISEKIMNSIARG